jgi:hypothetical protein
LRHRAVPVREVCPWNLPPWLARCTVYIPDGQYNRRHVRGPRGVHLQCGLWQLLQQGWCLWFSGIRLR